MSAGDRSDAPGPGGGTPPRGPVTIPANALAAIYRHARETFPEECCGYLVGDGPNLQVVPCQNRQNQLHALDPQAHPRTAANAYNISGRELLDLVRSFDGGRPATVIYHSHPEVGAYFSEEDARAADAAGYPVDYLVVDAQADHMGGAVLFRRDPGGAYLEIARYDGAEI